MISINSFMTISYKFHVRSLLSYDMLPKKPVLFGSFTGLTVREFDDIYKKEMAKRYGKHEIKRLSYRKDRGNDRWVQADHSN